MSGRFAPLPAPWGVRASASWRRANNLGRRHACGCLTRFDEGAWVSRIVEACAEHEQVAR